MCFVSYRWEQGTVEQCFSSTGMGTSSSFGRTDTFKEPHCTGLCPINSELEAEPGRGKGIMLSTLKAAMQSDIPHSPFSLHNSPKSNAPKIQTIGLYSPPKLKDKTTAFKSPPLEVRLLTAHKCAGPRTS